MRIVMVSGIFPPDIGGPATHAMDLKEEFERRGHEIVVLTLWDGGRVARHDGVVRIPRAWAWPVRLAAIGAWLVRHRQSYDCVYGLTMHPEAVTGARLARRPVVLKVSGDQAWERATRRGMTGLDFMEFQDRPPRDVKTRLMVALRGYAIGRAHAVTVPSRYMAGVIRTWTRAGVASTVIPNGIGLRRPEAEAVQRTSGELHAVFVGRLIPLKRVDDLLRAMAVTDGAKLEIVGDGSERDRLAEQVDALGIANRVRFAGRLAHEETLARVAAADVLVLPSAIENLPHVAIEALALGRPVIASNVGGVPEVVAAERTGLLVDADDPGHLAGALQRLRDDPELHHRLSEAALAEAVRWSFSGVAAQVADLLWQTIDHRPLLIGIGRGDTSDAALAKRTRQFEIVQRHLDFVAIAAGAGARRARLPCGARVVRLPALRPRLLETLVFYALGPPIALLLARPPRRAAVLCAPGAAFPVAVLRKLLPRRARPRVIVEVHGDWRTAPRLYGGRARRLVARPADWSAAWALRHADMVRVVSDSARHQVRDAGYDGPISQFIAYVDLRTFTETPPRPLPPSPHVAYAGVLERVKGVDVLIEAWAEVHREVPEARLTIAGAGPQRDVLQRRARELGIDRSVRFAGHVSPAAVRELLDESSCLVLPSRAEGLPRVILEAFTRRRAVVASRVGGIPQVIDDGTRGVLVEPCDPVELAGALVGILRDPEALHAMGVAGRRYILKEGRLVTFEDGMAELATWVATGEAHAAPMQGTLE